jgi:RNA recognition motif-containing protein
MMAIGEKVAATEMATTTTEKPKRRKSKAQIKRMMERAEARGEVYQMPSDPSSAPSSEDNDNDVAQHQHKEEISSTTIAELSTAAAADPGRTGDDDAVSKSSTTSATAVQATQSKKWDAAVRLIQDLADIESKHKDLKAKERRSMKRKAEAIATEASDCSASELLEWYKTEQNAKAKTSAESKTDDSKNSTDNKKERQSNRTNNPYTVFVGQLSFDTTKEDLLQHFVSNLAEHYPARRLTKNDFTIRLLTDPKTKKSRGMAFVQLVGHHHHHHNADDADNNKNSGSNKDPELLYACLKLHLTYLKGRRINVERSAGGGKVVREERVRQHRTEQSRYVERTVQEMLQERYRRGEMREHEIDAGCMELCRRHSATVVQAALDRYVDSNGGDMDNPSAYLTFLLGKLAEEGIYKKKEDGDVQKMKNNNNKRRSPHPDTTIERDSGSSRNQSSQKRPRKPSHSNNTNKESSFANSSFARQGVDMSVSEKGTRDSSQIFPSMSLRGRGRGGYMR